MKRLRGRAFDLNDRAAAGRCGRAYSTHRDPTGFWGGGSPRLRREHRIFRSTAQRNPLLSASSSWRRRP
eukprot:3014734-Prymnesium_polylepis.1